MPIVSVIVPVYMVEQYLDRCIKSIMMQTFKDFELILVDDGSPDMCPQICDEWSKRDERIIVIHKHNEGVSAARNSALDIAKGTYVTFCDSDDFWGNNHLNTLFEAIEKSGADVAISNYIKVAQNGTVLKDQISNHSIGTTTISSDEDRLQYLYTFSGLHGWECCTRLFRNKIIARNNIRFPTTCNNYAEDMAFVFNYNLHANVITSIDSSEYYYFQRLNSMMHTVDKCLKLNEINEISYWFYDKYINVFGHSKSVEYSIVHFLFMKAEYLKIVGTEKYQLLGNYFSTINNIKWHDMQTKNIRKCYKKLKFYFGKRFAQQIFLLSHYCIHKNWNRFKIESAVAYRYCIK